MNDVQCAPQPFQWLDNVISCNVNDKVKCKKMKGLFFVYIQSFMQNNLHFYYYFDTFIMLFCSQMERVGHTRNWLTCNKIETALG